MKIRSRTQVYFCLLAAWLALSSSFDHLSAADAIDPNLRLAIRRTNQSVGVSWFASNTVPYQVESSTTLEAWTNSSLVLTGSGAALSVWYPITGSKAFFRVKRVVP